MYRYMFNIANTYIRIHKSGLKTHRSFAAKEAREFPTLVGIELGAETEAGLGAFQPVNNMVSSTTESLY